MARGLKFRIKKVEELYYPCSENKDADQLRGYREADLRLCFRICGFLITRLIYEGSSALPQGTAQILAGFQPLISVVQDKYTKMICTPSKNQISFNQSETFQSSRRNISYTMSIETDQNGQKLRLICEFTRLICQFALFS